MQSRDNKHAHYVFTLKAKSRLCAFVSFDIQGTMLIESASCIPLLPTDNSAN
jgi:hypothetical protein